MNNPVRIPIPKIPFDPPVYMIRRAKKPFVLDGNIHKPFWDEAEWTDAFQDIEGPSLPTPRFETRAKMLWDDDNLYIAAVLYGDEIWANQNEHDCVIFRDNDFEIFIDPDSDTQEYVEYEMNANNANWDLLLTKAYRDNGSPINGLELKGLKSAVKINGAINDPSAHSKSWSVEVVIPFTTLNECSVLRRSPKAGEFYRMNFSRVQWKVDVKDGRFEKRTDPSTGAVLPEDNWVWAPTGVINIHYPEMWAFAFFCGSDSDTYSVPEIEMAKWPLRLLYYAENIYFDLHGNYTENVEILYEILKEHSACAENRSLPVSAGFPDPSGFLAETTSHSFEISLKTKDGILSVYSDGKIKLETGKRL